MARKPRKRGIPAREKLGARLDYHDPTAGVGGAPPARSALALRLALAIFGVVVMVALGVIALAVHAPVWAGIAFFLALTALIDAFIVHRRQATEL
jgi:hypothetical protein